MLNVPETLDKLGIALGALLGQGAFAKVYEYRDAETGKLDETRVVKITHDESDACAAELARRAQERGECKNVVRVFTVLRTLQAVDSFWAGREAYIIVSERLTPIPREVKDRMPQSSYAIWDGCYDPIRAVEKAVENGCINPAAHYLSPVPLACVDDVWTMAASNIVGMCQDLRKLGVTMWDDYKPANTMYRPGYGIVISDLGCTESPVPEILSAAA